MRKQTVTCDNCASQIIDVKKAITIKYYVVEADGKIVKKTKDACSNDCLKKLVDEIIVG